MHKLIIACLWLAYNAPCHRTTRHGSERQSNARLAATMGIRRWSVRYGRTAQYAILRLTHSNIASIIFWKDTRPPSDRWSHNKIDDNPRLDSGLPTITGTRIVPPTMSNPEMGRIDIGKKTTTTVPILKSLLVPKWRCRVSIPIRHACERSALPCELHPHDIGILYKLDKFNGVSLFQLSEYI